MLRSAEVKFLKPSTSGDALILKNGYRGQWKAQSVDVEGVDEAGTKIFVGVFTCFVLEKHLLE